MAKSKCGMGLLLGGLAGYFFSTESGKKALTKVKDEVISYKEDPAAYQENIKQQVADWSKDLTDLYENRHELARQLEGHLGEIQAAEQTEEVVVEAEAEVADITIDYQE